MKKWWLSVGHFQVPYITCYSTRKSYPNISPHLFPLGILLFRQYSSLEGKKRGSTFLETNRWAPGKIVYLDFTKKQILYELFHNTLVICENIVDYVVHTQTQWQDFVEYIALHIDALFQQKQKPTVQQGLCPWKMDLDSRSPCFGVPIVNFVWNHWKWNPDSLGNWTEYLCISSFAFCPIRKMHARMLVLGFFLFRCIWVR